MEVKIGYLYHIKDEYFDAINDDSLMQNHEKGKKRPTYFTIKDKNILWFIPISSKVDKYKQIIEDIKVYFDRYLENSSYTINFNNIYVKPRFINKSSTIEYLENKINIEKKDIFTIGDHNNDYEMIKDYNGFTMLWGTKMAREYAIKKYLFMSGLICDIENNNEKFVKKLRFR